MAEEPDEGKPGRRPRGVSRVSLFLLAAVAAGLGYWGFWEYRPPGTVAGDQWWDLVYYDLQLFGLEFAEAPGEPVPLPLQVARVLAPAATFIAAFFAIVGVSSILRRALRWGYVIVVGDTAEARAVARELRRRSVVELAQRAIGFGGVIEIDRGDLASLRFAGVKRARLVYALGDDRGDVAANVATALAAVTSRRPRVFVHVTDPELAVGLRARRLMTQVGQRVEFFTMDEVAAQAYVDTDRLGPDARPEILVAGAGSFGRSIIVAFARHWQKTSGRPGERVGVTLIDPQASRAREELIDRWTVVAEHCDITAVDEADPRVALRPGALGRPYRSYICYEDEHLALRTALAAAALWQGGPASLVVRLSQLSRHAEAFADGRLLDHLDGRLAVANVAALAAPYVAESRDIFDDLARATHARYVDKALAAGRRLGDRPALREWADLDPFFQESNRGQARHFAVKLREIGATVAPRSARNPPFVLTDAEVEHLAPLEHERWVQERRAAGWQPGALDEKRKRTPLLVPWDRLPEVERDKDREAVRAIPAEFGEVLAEFGLQIVRL